MTIYQTGIDYRYIACTYVITHTTIKCGDTLWRTHTTRINTVSGSSKNDKIIALKAAVNKIGRSAEHGVN